MINIKRLKTDQEGDGRSKLMEEEETDLPHSTVSSSYKGKKIKGKIKSCDWKYTLQT